MYVVTGMAFKAPRMHVKALKKLKSYFMDTFMPQIYGAPIYSQYS